MIAHCSYLWVITVAEYVSFSKKYCKEKKYIAGLVS